MAHCCRHYAGSYRRAGILRFMSSKAYSYLSDAPETCVNCHIMAHNTPPGSTVLIANTPLATTVMCHRTMYFAPIILKRWMARDMPPCLLLRLEPQNIFIKEAGIGVVQENCIRCHNALISDAELLVQTDLYQHKFEDRLCWECHREVPHGRVKSLSSTPYARVPMLPSPVPAWLNEMMNQK